MTLKRCCWQMWNNTSGGKNYGLSGPYCPYCGKKIKIIQD